MRVSLTEQMDGCPIREGENTGNVICSVANTKKNFSPDNVIYMFVPFNIGGPRGGYLP